MDSLVLHTQFEDPLAILAESWLLLSQHGSFSINTSEFSWNSVGTLPNIKYKDFLIPRENILGFLKLMLNLNEGLHPDLVSEGDLLEEYCTSTLYPAVLYAFWMEEETSKSFYTPSGNWAWKILAMPFTKLWFVIDKKKVREFLKRHHNVLTNAKAFLQVDTAHKLLSEKLGNSLFFNGLDTPHSTDIVVYSYLAFELKQLSQHSYVKDSLSKFKNLLDFVKRFECCLRLYKPEGNYVYEKEEDCKVPDLRPVQASDLASSVNHVDRYRFKHRLPQSSEPYTLKQTDRYVVSGIFCVLLLYLLKKT